MQARASVIKIEHLVGAQSGKPYARVNLAENFGKGEDRRTTYYNGVVFKEALLAVLKKGQLIEFKGILESKAFKRPSDGSLGTDNKVEIFDLTVLYEARDQSANAAQPATPPAQAQPGTPAAAQSEEEAMYAHHSTMVDEMAGADDIPF